MKIFQKRKISKGMLILGGTWLAGTQINDEFKYFTVGLWRGLRSIYVGAKIIAYYKIVLFY